MGNLITPQHIEIDADTGRPCVAGTGIRVWDVYCLHERQGKTVDEVVAAFPHLTLADVHAALAYYWDNHEEIDRQMREADEFVAGLKAASGPGPLARKLASRGAGGASVSP